MLAAAWASVAVAFELARDCSFCAKRSAIAASLPAVVAAASGAFFEENQRCHQDFWAGGLAAGATAALAALRLNSLLKKPGCLVFC
jgi:hypothetical protein